MSKASGKSSICSAPCSSRRISPLARALAEDFASLDATLAKYKNADGAFGSSANVSADDRKVMQDAAKKLSGELALIRGALGLS